MTLLPFVYSTGGSPSKAQRGDCVCRAIAIATETPYEDVYNMIRDVSSSERRTRNKGLSNPRSGVYKRTIYQVMTLLGWTWTPTMRIGSGCHVHLRAGEVPMTGRHVVSLSKHLTAIVDGVIYDTHDPSRDGMRCCYGYWSKKTQE